MTVTCPHCATAMEAGAAPPPMMRCTKCGGDVPTRPGAQPARKTSSGCFIALAIAGGSIPVLGILAAIAIPNFIKFQSRSKQAECRANLRSLYTAERAYYTDHHAYTPRFADLGFTPERGNRYAYFLGDGPLAARDTASNDLPADAEGLGVDRFKYAAYAPITATDVARVTEVGVRGTCPRCEITIVCAGNIDHDPPLDVWSISSDERKTTDGKPVPAGEPFAAQNDL